MDNEIAGELVGLWRSAPEEGETFREWLLEEALFAHRQVAIVVHPEPESLEFESLDLPRGIVTVDVHDLPKLTETGELLLVCSKILHFCEQRKFKPRTSQFDAGEEVREVLVRQNVGAILIKSAHKLRLKTLDSLYSWFCEINKDFHTDRPTHKTISIILIVPDEKPLLRQKRGNRLPEHVCLKPRFLEPSGLLLKPLTNDDKAEAKAITDREDGDFAPLLELLPIALRSVGLDPDLYPFKVEDGKDGERELHICNQFNRTIRVVLQSEDDPPLYLLLIEKHPGTGGQSFIFYAEKPYKVNAETLCCYLAHSLNPKPSGGGRALTKAFVKSLVLNEIGQHK